MGNISTLEYIIGGLLLVLAIALVWLIGAQQSKRKSGLSGSIAGNGASESYLSRNKIASKESSYKKITLVVAIVFVVLVLALYIIGSIDPKVDETTDPATNNAVEDTDTNENTESASSASSDASTESASSEASTSEPAASESSDAPVSSEAPVESTEESK